MCVIGLKDQALLGEKEPGASGARIRPTGAQAGVALDVCGAAYGGGPQGDGARPRDPQVFPGERGGLRACSPSVGQE